MTEILYDLPMLSSVSGSSSAVSPLQPEKA